MTSESSDEEIIPPMRKKRIRPLSPDGGEEIVNNNLKRNRIRKRVIEQYSLSEDEDSNSDEEEEEEEEEEIDPPYIQKVRKMKRNSGKRYRTQNGNIVYEKIFENKDCGCRYACHKNYDEEERKDMFDKFWGLADFNKQNLFLHKSVQRRIVQRRRPTNGKGAPRNFSFRYLLSSKIGKIPVCKRFFLDTFKVSDGRLKRLLNSTHVGNDMRGRMPGSSRQIPEEARKRVEKHIKKFFNFKAYYAATRSANGRCRHPDLTIRELFNLYKIHCQANGVKPVNEWTYRKIFKQMNQK